MQHPPSADSARISEIFSSLQGEGPYMGQKHIFIRFEECHIHCQYCDELDKPGHEMSLAQVLETVRSLEKEEGPHFFVSLTGGEPLLYLSFLKSLIPPLRAGGLAIYLETSGILWRALEEVIDFCDVIAMDMKPASVTGEKNFYAEHRRFLEIAKAKKAFIKIVLSKEIDTNEFEELIGIVDRTAPEVTVVLQPLSSDIEGHEDAELMELLERLQRRASTRLRDVRIVPRLHRILKIR